MTRAFSISRLIATTRLFQTGEGLLRDFETSIFVRVRLYWHAKHNHGDLTTVQMESEPTIEGNTEAQLTIGRLRPNTSYICQGGIKNKVDTTIRFLDNELHLIAGKLVVLAKSASDDSK